MITNFSNDFFKLCSWSLRAFEVYGIMIEETLNYSMEFTYQLQLEVGIDYLQIWHIDPALMEGDLYAIYHCKMTPVYCTYWLIESKDIYDIQGAIITY